MSTVITDPILRYACTGKFGFRFRKSSPPSSKYLKNPLLANAAIFCHPTSRPGAAVKASSSDNAIVVETLKSADDVIFMKTFPITRIETVEGRIFVRLDQKVEDGPNWELTVGCSLPGRWVLHWGVSYVDEIGSEWDQPPEEMRPPGSTPIKDYAIETPLQKSSDGDLFHEVKINLDRKSAVAAINFVLKDEETGHWYQDRREDFKVPFVDYLLDDGNVVGAEKDFNMWPGYKDAENLHSIFVYCVFTRFIIPVMNRCSQSQILLWSSLENKLHI